MSVSEVPVEGEKNQRQAMLLGGLAVLCWSTVATATSHHAARLTEQTPTVQFAVKSFLK